MKRTTVRGRRGTRLSHLCDQTGRPVCGRVAPLVEASTFELAGPPSCPSCRRRWGITPTVVVATLALVAVACGDASEPEPSEPGYAGAVVCDDSGAPTRCVPDRGAK